MVEMEAIEKIITVLL